MKENRDPVKHNAEVAKMFDDLQPFTITVSNGHDASWLSSAMLLWLANGDYGMSERMLDCIIRSATSLGVEKGVSLFFDMGLKTGHKFPMFLKPVLIHMITHALKDVEKGKR